MSRKRNRNKETVPQQPSVNTAVQASSGFPHPDDIEHPCSDRGIYNTPQVFQGRMSPDLSNSFDRDRLIAQCRHEFAYNAFAGGITETKSLLVIGTGAKLSITDDGTFRDKKRYRAFAREVEDSFHDWAEQAELWKKLRLGRNAIDYDGEFFVRVVQDDDMIGRQPPINIELVESRRVRTPFGHIPVNEELDGIYYHSGKPYQYAVQREDNAFVLQNSLEIFDLVPSQQVIHYFRPFFISQYRGLPRMLRVLDFLIMLRRYIYALVVHEETAASITGVMQTTLPPSIRDGGSFPTHDSKSYKPGGTFKTKIGPGMTAMLPFGFEYKQFGVDNPASTCSDVIRSIAGVVGRGYNLPANLASLDSSNSNFASGQLDHKIAFRDAAIEHQDMEYPMLRRIFDWYILGGMDVIPALQKRRVREAYGPYGTRRIPIKWVWTSMETSDQLKATNARVKQMQSGMLGLAEAVGLDGKDFRTHIETIAKEVKEIHEAFKNEGIDIPPEAIARDIYGIDALIQTEMNASDISANNEESEINEPEQQRTIA